MRSDRPLDQSIRNAWRQLFDAWKHVEDSDREWHTLQSVIETDGWSSAIVRRFGEVHHPHLSVTLSPWNNPKLLEAKFAQRNKASLLKMDVKYPIMGERIEIPNEWRSAIAKALRQNLELARPLEQEVVGYGLINIIPIVKDDDENIDANQQTVGPSAFIVQFINLFTQLVNFNESAAK